jgi:hypothetical protein
MVTAFDDVAIYKTQIKVYRGDRFAKHWTYEAFLNWIKDGTITLIPSNGFIKALVNYPALKARGLQEAHDPYHE